MQELTDRTDESGRRSSPTWPRRLLLVAVLVAGGVALRALDEVVIGGYRADVEAQAMQAASAVEGALGIRVARLHALQRSLAEAMTAVDRRNRFHVIAREIEQSGHDVRFQYLIDTTGSILEMDVADSTEFMPAVGQLSVAGSSEAFRAAREQRGTQLSATVPLRGGGTGLVVYDPIVQRGRVVGFVGAGFPYAALFDGSLAVQLRGRSPYRVIDDAGSTISHSSTFPVRLSNADAHRVVAHAVALPGGRRWELQFLIGATEPAAARAALWLVGATLLTTLTLVAIREERRAEAAALHTIRLEGLSRDLLDANVTLEERAAQVAEANRAKSRFLAHVSHELRTPLNAILGYNGLALEGVYGAMPPRLNDAHERIRASATHLLGVVDAVLDLSKLELNRLDVVPGDVRVEALLADVAAMVEAGAHAKSLRLDVVVEANVPTLETDVRHLRRALLALTTNAIKYTDRGAVILAASYDAATDPPSVALAVEDSGPGIAAADQARIFEEFEQVRPQGRGDSIARGAGLGLAVARKLVRALGGDVKLVSALGAGARFVITLPVRAPTAVSRP